MTEQVQKTSISHEQNTRTQINTSFLVRNEFLIPSGLFVLFLIFALPGISWGAPAGWHPDEVVYIAIRALRADYDFDSSNFNHPHLPIYAMFGLGKLLLALGQTNREVLIGARVLSAVLVGLTIVVTYYIPRRMGYNVLVSGLSGLLVLVNSELIHNAHFAHNDTFVTFFSTLTILLLVQYKTKGQRGWLYATFYCAGLAISSKYSAMSLAALPFLVFFWMTRKSISKRPLRVLETLFIGSALTYFGYATGTPKALTWMAYYMKRLIPALLYNSNYGVLPDSVKGILGQYGVMLHGVGLFLFLIFALSLLWTLYRIYLSWRSGTWKEESNRILLFIAILVIDLPIAVSYNYPIRFFLPLMPLLAILGALFIHDLYSLAQKKSPRYSQLIGTGLILITVFSMARVLGVMLLFVHDSRIPATAFVATLPAGTSLEGTFYSPSIPANHFEREHNYPLFFPKSPDQSPPTNKNYVYNAGEAGLDERETDYFITDSFTIDKFNNAYTCESMRVECDFFKQLATGQSNHYQLIAEFSYALPGFLPQIQVDFVNPTIRIYKRIP
jgi:4-amino-4-deoxy-L-arabinose transferase-like glycosyltransferase